MQPIWDLKKQVWPRNVCPTRNELTATQTLVARKKIVELEDVNIAHKIFPTGTFPRAIFPKAMDIGWKGSLRILDMDSGN